MTRYRAGRLRGPELMGPTLARGFRRVRAERSPDSAKGASDLGHEQLVKDADRSWEGHRSGLVVPDGGLSACSGAPALYRLTGYPRRRGAEYNSTHDGKPKAAGAAGASGADC
jgi:hypothetical protein